jgi:Tfp pilus assembly protein PilO
VNLPVDREFLTQTVIALGACLGGWMFFVQPKAEAIQEVQASIQKLRSQTAAAGSLGIEEIAKQAPVLRTRSSEIEARGAFAEDTSQLYGRIMDLAKAHQVQVRNLRPGDRKFGKDKNVTLTRIDMTAQGEYEQIARFLDSLNGIGAYLRMTSVQIAPTKQAGGSGTVMQLGFEVLQFHLPKVVREMKGMGNGSS